MSEENKDPIKEAEIVKAEVVKVKNKPYSRPRQLTQKQINFIKETIKDPTAKLADRVLRAGYNAKDRNLASRVGNSIMQNVLVQNELKRYINDGNLDNKAIETLNEIMDEDVSNMEKASERVAARKLKLEVIQEIHKIQGNYAPKRTENKTARFNFNVPKRIND